MKQIKFRAFDKRNNEMVYSSDEDSFYVNTKGVLFMYALPKSETGLKTEYYKSYEVEQFTGLKDKNGTEIYENDLMKDLDGRFFRIYGTYAGFIIKAKYWADDIDDLIPVDELIFEPLSDPQTAQWLQTTCEVVGNIHENKTKWNQ